MFKGKLKIELVSAKLTYNTETFGRMDPFVSFRTPNQEWRSRTCDDGGKHPKWTNQTVYFKPKTFEQEVHIQCIEEDVLSNDFIGDTRITMDTFMQNEGIEDHQIEIFHKEKSAGLLYIRSIWTPPAEAEEDAEDEAIEDGPIKALILVGGYGTRLRPFTIDKPKPMVDFINKPCLVHQLEALYAVGVTEVVLALQHMPETLQRDLEPWMESIGDMTIHYRVEDVPMGTAGPIAFSSDLIRSEEPGSLFFVFNSDVACEFPLTDMIEFHRQHKGEGTIAVTRVEEPSKYGVVVTQKDADQDDEIAVNRIERFVEKPKKFVSDNINAGLYLFDMRILDRIPNEPCSIERQIFPEMASDGMIFQYPLSGFWMDIGQPKDYLIGQALYIKRKKEIGEELENHSIIHESATVAEGSEIGPNVVIGENCVIESCVKLENTTILSGTTIRKGSYITKSIIGWKNEVGKWCRIEESFTGEDVKVKDKSMLREVKILPHKAVEGKLKKEIIM